MFLYFQATEMSHCLEKCPFLGKKKIEIQKQNSNTKPKTQTNTSGEPNYLPVLFQNNERKKLQGCKGLIREEVKQGKLLYKILIKRLD